MLNALYLIVARETRQEGHVEAVTKEKYWILIFNITITAGKINAEPTKNIIIKQLTSSTICFNLSWIPCATLYFSLWLVFLLFLNCLAKLDTLSWTSKIVFVINRCNSSYKTTIIVNYISFRLFKNQIIFLPFRLGTFLLFLCPTVFCRGLTVH